MGSEYKVNADALSQIACTKLESEFLPVKMSSC